MMTWSEDAKLVWSVETGRKAFVYGWIGGECALRREEAGLRRVRRMLAVDAGAAKRLFRDLNGKVSRVRRCRGRGRWSERKENRMTGRVQLDWTLRGIRFRLIVGPRDNVNRSRHNRELAAAEHFLLACQHVSFFLITIMDAIYAQTLLAD